ncbi:hypothetical protein WA026_000691 [Henosepilachna vigintioctopunctata]|uniref:Serine/threonine-protein phosphatase 1 regulatory subunit 10 n=1 Tax=Henosepilachna vigintioctopunctata TaxID=420089 RepID=A0AAW1V036_9CUCU
MPRIDPLQLLKCLSVLLSPEGGIMSREEVPRLVNLMTKFSKKLVSKCVYLLILKSTDDTLVDMFMASGGWLLIHTWLQEAMASSNWNLVQEILELLLVTPVDSSRLRLNNIPKLVKTLSKREDLGDVKEMAASLVNNWLAIVKNSTVAIQEAEKQLEKPSETPIEIIEIAKEVDNEPPKVTNEIETVELQEAPVVEDVPSKIEVEDEDSMSTGMVYKITVRDGKQVITKLGTSEELEEKHIIDESDGSDKILDKKDDMKENKETKPKTLELKPRSNSSKSKSSSSSSSSKKSSSSTSSRSSSSMSTKDKEKRHSSSSRHSSKSSSSLKDKEKSRKDKENDKDKHKNNGSVKHNSSGGNKSSSNSSSREKDKKDSKESKDKQADKDKDTLAKIKPVTLDKIGRIPKKIVSSDEKDVEVKKKPSMSIEPKKKAEDRPKTVKIFNSKMRSTGLEEEVKPPPPRNAVKKPPPVIPPVLPLPCKRPSPPKDSPSTPPEKKLRIDFPERAGSIKLIPPKPKPPVLLESDIFMDALTAATSKKEPKKRKRRASVSKESPEDSPSVVPPATNSPLGLKNFTPANFYQDTLETTDETEETNEDRAEETCEEKMEESIEMKVDATNSDDVSEISEPSTRTNSDGLKGVLVYLKRKGPKRSVRWKEERDLVEVKYFELDETERINVSRTNFTDMAKLEMTNEREALLGRKLMNEDLMEPTTLWRIPYIVDQSELPVQPGCKSLEKDIQYAREKNILQALYFNKNLIPDTPAEPIFETHAMVDPVIIPLEDAESQVYDLRNTAWPEPKGMPPVEEPPAIIPPMFTNIPGPFPNFPQMGMPPQGFPGLQGPGFCPPNMMPNGPPNMMHNGNMNMMGNPNMNMGAPMEMMNQPPMNPNMFGPGGPNMDNFNPMMNDNPNFPMPYNQPNMYGPPNNNFNNMDRGGGHRGRGGFRRGHNNNNWGRNHPRGGNNWRNNRDDHRGGTGRICKNVKNHGYCRNIETCPFVHPN